MRNFLRGLLFPALSPCFVSAFSVNKYEYIAKTQETFKFSDLQELQMRLDAKSDIRQPCQCQRLVLDPATGSAIFHWTFDCPLNDEMTDRDPRTSDPTSSWPPSLARCEWVAQVLAFGSSANELVGKLRTSGGVEMPHGTGWKLDYLRINEGEKLNPRYTLKTLLCSVAQTIQLQAALNLEDASEELILVETIHSGIFLGRIVSRCSSKADTRRSLWAKRPFQYSSAIHPTVAEIAVDLLLDRDKSGEDQTTTLLDATCGSGSFLATALACQSNVHVIGWDINSQCIQGTRQNIRYAFDDDVLQNRCSLRVLDSSSVAANHDGTPKNDGTCIQKIDCVVANLPWGKNTVDYANQNVRILHSVRTLLRDGILCIFVHNDDKLSSVESMRRLGFEILGEAFVPPLNFRLPKSKKTARHSESGNGVEALMENKSAGKKHQRVTVVKTVPLF